jgi:metallo-beta-lactamase family protein
MRLYCREILSWPDQTHTLRTMKLQFLGATERVTGSCYLITVGGRRVLLDCGQFQGNDEDQALNGAPLPVDAEQIDAVVLSHAHIDHSGRLPLLRKNGFRGPIYTHRASRSLCAIMLRDSGYLHEKDVEWENRKRDRKGLPHLEPLYTQADGEAVMQQFRGLRYGEKTEVLPGLTVRFGNAGHILGSAVVELWLTESDQTRKIAFSGDLGYRDAPLLPPADTISNADLVLLESTYGDRLHRPFESTLEELGSVFDEARRNGGNIIIPAFAVGRTQDFRVFLDSPMAIEATETYAQFRNLYESELFRPGTREVRLPNLTMSRRSDESMAINRIRSSAVIIAGSGMCSGGRVLHHLKHNVWRPECHVVIVGFQAYGTLGRRLVDGAETIRLWGEEIQVKAAVRTVGGLSAHGDQSDLLDWYGAFKNAPPVCLVHGEPAAQKALAAKIQERFGVDAHIPRFEERLDLATIGSKGGT